MDNRTPDSSHNDKLAAFDGHLLLERLKSWYRLYLAAFLAGAALAGGLYYIFAIAYGPQETYQSVSSYYIDYASLPEAPGDGSYNNAGAWEELLRGDYFTGVLASDLPEDISNEELKASLSVIMHKDNDARYYKLPSIAVTTHDPDICMQISDAVHEHFPDFALGQEHVTSVRRTDAAAGAVNISPSPRLLQAVLLGGFLGLFASVTFTFVYEMKSRDVWLPSGVTAKYGIITAGLPGDRFLSVNLEYMYRSCSTMALVTPDSAGAPESIYEKLLQTCGEFMDGKRWVQILTAGKAIENINILNSVDGVLLIIPSGHGSANGLSSVTDRLRRQSDSSLTVGCILWNGDLSLIRRYYGA